MDQFLAMGGYAAFIWPSYAMSVIVLALMAALSLSANRQVHVMLRRMESEKVGG
jgi:heme exporter protein CcmD